MLKKTNIKQMAIVIVITGLYCIYGTCSFVSKVTINHRFPTEFTYTFYILFFTTLSTYFIFFFSRKRGLLLTILSSVIAGYLLGITVWLISLLSITQVRYIFLESANISNYFFIIFLGSLISTNHVFIGLAIGLTCFVIFIISRFLQKLFTYDV